MFMYETDFAEHIAKLHDNAIDTYMFKLSREEIQDHKSNVFFHDVLKKILTGEKEHTLLIIEETNKGWEKHLTQKLKTLGRRIDNEKNHQISFFMIEKEFFDVMSEKVKKWDNWQSPKDKQ